MRCPNCEGQISSNSRFCLFCGQAVTPAYSGQSYRQPDQYREQAAVRYATATVEYHEPDGTNLLGWIFTGPYGYAQFHGETERRRIPGSNVSALRAKMGQQGWELVSTHSQKYEGWTVTIYEYQRRIA